MDKPDFYQTEGRPTLEEVLQKIEGSPIRRQGDHVAYMVCVDEEQPFSWLKKLMNVPKRYAVRIMRYDSQDDMYFRDGIEMAAANMLRGAECHVFETKSGTICYHGLYLSRFYEKAIAKARDRAEVPLQAYMKLTARIAMPDAAKRLGQTKALD